MAVCTQHADSIASHHCNYINGQWVRSSGTGLLDIVSPSTEEVIGRVALGTSSDVDKAVAAARTAFETWSQVSLDERGNVLLRVADELEGRQEELAVLTSRQVGMPISLSRIVEGIVPPIMFRGFVDIMKTFVYEEAEEKWLNIREPIGVVGAITPWNYPTYLMCGKLAPALAAGCTVVLKPSEIKPLNSYILAEALDKAGVPQGVVNIVNGTGLEVGEAIASHPGVDMVHFTGSGRAGRRVSELAAQTIKRVALELGGKSACVILEGAELPKAVKAGVSDCYANTGQTCCSQTRMLVPRHRHDEAVEIAKQAAEAMVVGDPLQKETNLGPLASETQRERVRALIKKGIDEGATLATGGYDAPAGLDKGYYVRPTVFGNVSNDSTIAREEIFGPVLCIIPYSDEEEAIRLANDSVYGLSGGVWAESKEHAEAVARRIRTGQVFINGAGMNLMAPFGGYKQSGNGREYGKHGFAEYFEMKSLQRD